MGPPLQKKMKRDISFEATINTLYSSQHKGAALSIASQDREQTVSKMKQYLNRIINHADSDSVAHFKKHWSFTPGNKPHIVYTKPSYNFNPFYL